MEKTCIVIGSCLLFLALFMQVTWLRKTTCVCIFFTLMMAITSGISTCIVAIGRLLPLESHITKIETLLGIENLAAELFAIWLISTLIAILLWSLLPARSSEPVITRIHTITGR